MRMPLCTPLTLRSLTYEEGKLRTHAFSSKCSSRNADGTRRKRRTPPKCATCPNNASFQRGQDGEWRLGGREK
ncbi:hypothetical protein POVWA2_032650 [Plasmodium ovale wallikeri]|uniref:Uncharacterized protein n=1 Tax=Plasmodium ovale wallikeri TaxID=864142 RepID=A0A1A8YZE1_PLAOA|nr:hypothetical protein POVWA1_033030 [Plasmodium ovale wallikeri]SBT36974.1 hypothetical protein POVWA2_032650 [Plasmodium ovale wallikeri]